MKTPSNSFTDKGFTLVEILVVVAIVTLIVSVLGFNALQSGQKSRDAKRQADITLLQNAVELYKSKYGRYPSQCATTGASANGWSGQLGTDYACSDGTNQYIVGLAPEFIPVLPQEKKLNGVNSGYVYRVNADGTVYKIKAHRTVESETVTYLHEYKACDVRVASNPDGSLNSGSGDIEVLGWCGRVSFNARNLAPECRSTSDSWRYSYGIWGGIAALQSPGTSTLTGLNNTQKVDAVRDTTTVICR